MDVARYSFEDSWDAIWRCQWFERDAWRSAFRDQEDMRHLLAVARATMPLPDYRRVLDCTSGLGAKSIVLAEMGYEVQGADGSAEGVRIAERFALRFDEVDGC